VYYIFYTNTHRPFAIALLAETMTETSSADRIGIQHFVTM